MAAISKRRNRRVTRLTRDYYAEIGKKIADMASQSDAGKAIATLAISASLDSIQPESFDVFLKDDPSFRNGYAAGFHLHLYDEFEIHIEIIDPHTIISRTVREANQWPN